jgi:hypothetical protein
VLCQPLPHGGLVLDDEAAALFALAFQAPRSTWPPAVAGLANQLVMRGEEAAARLKTRQGVQSPEGPAQSSNESCSCSRQETTLLTVAEAAERSGLRAGRIRDLLASGRLVGRKAGPKVWLVDPLSLDVYTRARSVSRDGGAESPAGL